MSFSAQFIFNIPAQFAAPAEFVQWLNDELGLALTPARDGVSWDGPHLGLFLHFAPDHGFEAEPNLPYDGYRAAIAIDGYAGQGDLRVMMLSAVINIALALCFRLKLDGVVIWDGQVRIARFGVKGEEEWLWDLDRDRRIRSFEDIKPIITEGVDY